MQLRCISSKQGNKNYYKGNRSGRVGSWTTKGMFFLLNLNGGSGYSEGIILPLVFQRNCDSLECSLRDNMIAAYWLSVFTFTI